VLRLLSDENFNDDIVSGLLRHLNSLELVRVQDVGLAQAEDPAILEWAAVHGRILITHDRKTIPRFAYERIQLGQSMPGVFIVSDALPIGRSIDELLLAVQCLTPEECNDLVRFLPL
jgi:hypothetical protein